MPDVVHRIFWPSARKDNQVRMLDEEYMHEVLNKFLNIGYTQDVSYFNNFVNKNTHFNLRHQDMAITFFVKHTVIK